MATRTRLEFAEFLPLIRRPDSARLYVLIAIRRSTPGQTNHVPVSVPRAIPPCHAQMLPFGSRSLGPVGRRPSLRHDGQTYQWRSRSSSTHQGGEEAGRVRYWEAGRDIGKRDGSDIGKRDAILGSGTGPILGEEAGRVRVRRLFCLPTLPIADLSRFPPPDLSRFPPHCQ
jgi:hypothetical protein